MKKTSRSADGEEPGALALETQGDSAATSTINSSSHLPEIAEVTVEVQPTAEKTAASARPSTSRPGHRERHRPAGSAASSIRVLVADDSLGVRELLAKTLREEGYEVLLAQDGQDAIEKYASGLIDLVLLDLDMPVKSGWETFEEIVALAPEQAVILLAESTDAVDLSTSGPMARVAEKPLNMHSLLDSVRGALAETGVLRRSAIASQQSLLRYTRPYVSPAVEAASYDHWGIND